MGSRAVSGLLEYIHPAQEYLQSHFGLEASTAEQVVEGVLLGLFRKGPEKLRRPRRYLFQACRIRAFQLLRSRRRQEALDAAKSRREETEKKDNAILIALEDEDKPKFFGQATPEPKETLNVVLEQYGTSEVTATMETPESSIRLRLQLGRKRLEEVA